MVDPKSSTICSKRREISSIRPPSQSSVPNSKSATASHTSFNQLPSTLKKSAPSSSQVKPVSANVSNPQQHIPNCSSYGRIRSGQTITPSSNDHITSISNEVDCGSIVQRQGSERIITPRTNHRDPVSAEVMRKSAVRRHKNRITISPATNDVSNPETENPPTVENENPDIVIAMDGVGGSAYYHSQGNARKRQRGACNSSKVSQIVRTSKNPVRVRLDEGHGHPTGLNVCSLLSHAIGVQVRKFIPMHDGYWRNVDALKKDEAIRSLLSYFDFETDEQGQFETGICEYLEQQFAKMFREFKFELHDYFLDFTPEEARLNPPLEWANREKEDWSSMCDHFLSDRFQNQSKANKENRGRKQYEHHGDAKPIALRYEEQVKNGSQFPDIDAFRDAYTNKAGEWTSDVVQKHHDKMVSQSKELLKELAAGYPDGTPDKDIIVPTDAGQKILMQTLGIKPGRQIRGLGFGRYRELGSSSKTGASSVRLKELENEVAVERKARLDMEQAMQVERKARLDMERHMQVFMRAVSTQIPGLSFPQVFSASLENEHEHEYGDDDHVTSP